VELGRYSPGVSPDPDPSLGHDGVLEGLGRDVERLADRLRSLSQPRLEAPVPGHASRADGGRAVAQTLATAAQGVEERAAAEEPAWRTVPALSPFAAGDQVAVTGTDLVAAATGLDPYEEVWTPVGRARLADVVAAAAERLADLRRLL
jgi:hypothetical protein